MEHTRVIGLLFTVLGALVVIENSKYVWPHASRFEGQIYVKLPDNSVTTWNTLAKIFERSTANPASQDNKTGNVGLPNNTGIAMLAEVVIDMGEFANNTGNATADTDKGNVTQPADNEGNATQLVDKKNATHLVDNSTSPNNKTSMLDNKTTYKDKNDSYLIGCSIANILIGIIQVLSSYHLYKRDATLRRWVLINLALAVGLLITFSIALSNSVSQPRFGFFAGLDFFILAVVIIIDFFESQNWTAY